MASETAWLVKMQQSEILHGAVDDWRSNDLSCLRLAGPAVQSFFHHGKSRFELLILVIKFENSLTSSLLRSERMSLAASTRAPLNAAT